MLAADASHFLEALNACTSLVHAKPLAVAESR